MHEWMGENDKAVAIFRVSSLRQKDNASLEAQEATVRAYCKENGLNIVRAEPLIESASADAVRKKYSAVINYALEKNIRHIVYYMADRESRNLTDLEKSEKLVKADIVVLHYALEKKVFHSKSPDMEFLMRDILTTVNKNFSRGLSTKVVAAMIAKAEQGWYPGNRPPLGYICVPTLDDNGRPIKGQGRIGPTKDERELRLIRREFELAAADLSLESIRKTCIAEGLVSPEKISEYRATSIDKRLKNPFYYGRFIFAGKEYAGKHELIIPVRHLEALKKRQGGKKIKPLTANGIFGGSWIKCAECGCAIVYDPKRKKYRNGKTQTFNYYRCSNMRKAHEKRSHISEEKLWDEFEKVIEAITLPPDVAKQVADAFNSTERERFASVRKQIDDYKIRLESLRSRENMLVDQMGDGVLDREVFKRQIKRLHDETFEINSQIQSLQASVSSKSRKNIDSIFELSIRSKSLWKKQTSAEKRDFLEKLVSNPRLRGLSIEYSLKKPFDFLEAVRKVVLASPRGQYSNENPSDIATLNAYHSLSSVASKYSPSASEFPSIEPSLVRSSSPERGAQ